MAEEESVSVECHSGARYGQRPTAFTWQAQRHEVAAVIREWRTPAGYCYRVITQDEQLYDLMYDEQADEWSLVSLR